MKPDDTVKPDPRFFVTEPVEGAEGDPYYDVRDRESTIFPNFELVSIHKSVKSARWLADTIAAGMNVGRIFE